MPQDDLYAELGAAPAPAKKSAPKKTSSSDLYADLGGTATPPGGPIAAASTAPPSPESEQPTGNILTRPLSETILGTSATKMYEGIAKRLFPETMQRDKGAPWMGRFSAELAKGAPEALDFIQSPMGAALVAAHMFPATAPFAAIVDVGLGGTGLMESIPAVKKAMSDQTPESWADAVKQIAFSMGMLKGGAKTLVSRTAAMHIEPLAEREVLREKLSESGTRKEKLERLAVAAKPPESKLLQLSEKMYGSALLREPAKIINIPKPRLMQISADLVSDRLDFLNERNLDINNLVYDFKHEVPVEDRQINKMGYVIQGSATADEVGLSPAARKALPQIRKWVEEQDKLLREAYGPEIPLQDAQTYLTQVWDMPEKDEAFRNYAARTLMNDPYLKKKTIESYKHGIEDLGMKPKINDVADLLKRRADFASKAIANRRMAGWLRDMGVILSENEFRQLKPKGWERATDAVSLYRAAYSGQPGGEGGLMFKPVYVHPQFKDAVNAVYGKSWDHPSFVPFETMRALGKHTALTFSMFHHWALTEQAHAIYATRRNPITTLSKTFFWNPEFYRGMKSGIWEAIGREGDKPPVMRMNPEMVREWVRHGMNLKSEESEHWLYGRLRDMASSQNMAAKAIGVTLKPVGTILKAWDTALWDFYHQGMMLDAAETIWADEHAKLGPNPDPAILKERRRAVAEHVNNAFGAVSFEKMLLSPKARQAINFLFLAPAWTTSNIRVLTSGFENEANHRLVDKYVKGAALSWFVTTQALNYALSGWYNRDEKGNMKPRWTWENPGLPAKIAGHALPGLSENAFNIYAGKNKDQSDRYIVLGKGFREPLNWMLAPETTFWNKVSLPVRLTMTLGTGHAPGSGFEEIDPRALPEEQLAQEAMAASEGLGVPFVARGLVQGAAHAIAPDKIAAPMASSQFMSLPTRKGASFMRVLRAYKEARRDNDWDQASTILAVAAQNRIDPKRIIATYNADQRKKQKQIRGPAVESDPYGNLVEK